MILPAEIVGSKQINFDAKSIRCNKDINPDFYNIGFQLQNVEPRDTEIIKRLIGEFGFQD